MGRDHGETTGGNHAQDHRRRDRCGSGDRARRRCRGRWLPVQDHAQQCGGGAAAGRRDLEHRRGQGERQARPGARTATYNLRITEPITNVLQAHLHRGAAGSNGPIAVWLYPSAPPASLIPGVTEGALARRRVRSVQPVLLADRAVLRERRRQLGRLRHRPRERERLRQRPHCRLSGRRDPRPGPSQPRPRLTNFAPTQVPAGSPGLLLLRWWNTVPGVVLGLDLGEPQAGVVAIGVAKLGCCIVGVEEVDVDAGGGDGELAESPWSHPASTCEWCRLSTSKAAAAIVADAELADAVAVYAARSVARGLETLARKEVSGDAPWRLYRACASAVYVLEDERDRCVAVQLAR